MDSATVQIKRLPHWLPGFGGAYDASYVSPSDLGVLKEVVSTQERSIIFTATFMSKQFTYDYQAVTVKLARNLSEILTKNVGETLTQPGNWKSNPDRRRLGLECQKPGAAPYHATQSCLVFNMEQSRANKRVTSRMRRLIADHTGCAPYGNDEARMSEHLQRSNSSQIRRGRPKLFIERRHATRFYLQLPVIVRWRDGSELREAHTRCEELSTKGISFVLAEDISDGTKVEVEVTLPTQITLDKPVRVVCSGHVQRKDLEGAKPHVAAVIESYRFLYDSIPAA
jgi:hypothetical protein